MITTKMKHHLSFLICVYSLFVIKYIKPMLLFAYTYTKISESEIGKYYRHIINVSSYKITCDAREIHTDRQYVSFNDYILIHIFILDKHHSCFLECREINFTHIMVFVLIFLTVILKLIEHEILLI